MIPPGLRPCGIGMRQQQGWDQSTGLHNYRDYHVFALRLKSVTPRFRLFATYAYVDKFTTFVRGYSYRKLMRI